MLPDVFLDEGARRRRVERESLLDGLLRHGKGTVVSLALGEVEAHVRQELDRRIEEHGSFDAIGREVGELEDQPAAVRVADESCALDARVLDRLEDVGDMRCDRPRRLP